jgi:hypothetical protein
MHTGSLLKNSSGERKKNVAVDRPHAICLYLQFHVRLFHNKRTSKTDYLILSVGYILLEPSNYSRKQHHQRRRLRVGVLLPGACIIQDSLGTNLAASINRRHCVLPARKQHSGMVMMWKCFQHISRGDYRQFNLFHNNSGLVDSCHHNRRTPTENDELQI